MTRITRRLSPSMIIALIALFVSMGGVSYGLATGSVDSREIKNKTIRDKDVKRNAIRLGLGPNSVQGDEIVNKSIRDIEVGDQQLGDRAIRENELDIQRLAGVPAGRYLKDAIRVKRDSAGGTTSPKSIAAPCPAGTRLLGGGARTFNTDVVAIADSGPTGDPGNESWSVKGYETSADADWSISAFAICG